MNPLNSLIFGIGLFFLGLQLVGDNLRRLIGPGFREVIKKSAHSPVMAASLGAGAGALLQSATAVTFILVSMTSAGLISTAAAAPIVIWGNVGTTVLAFVVNLNIHPLAAFVVGGAGIAWGMIRKPSWKAIAGALLGLGLILIGLEQMGAGAGPLKDAEWFRKSMDAATHNPLLAFAAGIGAAVVLQSNSGAALLVITLGASGAIPFHAALLMIYGTNLGTIGLRSVLAAGLHGDQFRLVMLENLFCLAGGLLLLLLYAVELAGIPLIAAFIASLPVSINLKLAVAFLFSNLIPALAISPILAPGQRFIRRLWPDKHGSLDLAKPEFLHPNALDDPPGALDLMARELSRLLGSIQITSPPEAAPDEPNKSFASLSSAIETFASQLAAKNSLNESTARILHIRRAELSIIRHIEESIRYYSQAKERNASSPAFDRALTDLLSRATLATADRDKEAITRLAEDSRIKGSYIAGLQTTSLQQGASLGLSAAFEDFASAAWGIHRLAMTLTRND